MGIGRALGITLGVVVLIIGASWLSYRLIERPAQKWLNARWPRD